MVMPWRASNTRGKRVAAKAFGDGKATAWPFSSRMLRIGLSLRTTSRPRRGLLPSRIRGM